MTEVVQEKRVNWKRAMGKYGMVGHHAHSPDTHVAMPANEQSQIASAARCSDRVRSWRRRVLLKRGVRMHAAMGADVQTCTLAMLDETGVVVSWYGRADGADRATDHVLDRHVSQFYIPEDVASKQPLRDLHAAVVEGRDTRQGWRRRTDGTVFWGTTVIEAVVLRDGRLQGFFVSAARQRRLFRLAWRVRLPQHERDCVMYPLRSNLPSGRSAL